MYRNFYGVLIRLQRLIWNTLFTDIEFSNHPINPYVLLPHKYL